MMAMIACVSTSNVVRAGPLKVVDIIPFQDSAETQQNAEPSLGVNPLDASQMIASAATGLVNSSKTAVTYPYYASTSGGISWFDFGSLQTNDKSIAWKQNGSAALTATLNADNSNSVFSATIAEGSFKNTIIQNNSSKGSLLDQPWIRTGTPSAANPDPIYVGYNDLNNGNGKTASVLVNNGGGISSIVTIDRMGGTAGQDAPSVRLAVNRDTVYSAFIRWDTVVESGANGNRYGSEVVVVRSDNGGADGFLALGPNGDGVTVAAPTSPFTGTGKPSPSNPLSVGAERVGSDLAIAVDPKNKDHVVVAYVDAPSPDGSNLMKVVVKGSTDGGNTWDRKFETTSSIMTRQALPSLAILDNGVIALLYLQYESDFNSLSTHLLATADDFVTTRETIIAEASNAFPVPDPNINIYVGDFFDMTSIGSIIYGVFSASNADTCGEFLIGPACFPNDVAFQRAHDGTPGTEDFTLCTPSTVCIPVGFSIDRFFSR